MRAKSNFASRFKLIWAVQSLREKYFASVFQKSVASLSASRLIEDGRIAIVTNVERGMRWTRRCRVRMRSQGEQNS
jgi:hypothetical protein